LHAADWAEPTHLLIVILDGLGRAVVHHVPDVGLVDAHSKRDVATITLALPERKLKCAVSRAPLSSEPW
jgi:hypothetical protein